MNFGAVLPAPCTHTCIAWLFCALLTVGGPACVVAVEFPLLPTNKDKQSNALVLTESGMSTGLRVTSWKDMREASSLPVDLHWVLCFAS